LLVMRPRLSLMALALGLAVVGLGASIASLIDTFAVSPTFCAETGCATVRESAWAHPFGIPMPVLGVVFFVAAIVLCFVDAPRLRGAVALAGAAVGVCLLVVQALVIDAWCKLCLIADPAAIGFAALVLGGATTLRFTPARGLAMLPALGATFGMLALWSAPPAPAPLPAVASGLPGFVERAQVPGTATVVEVVDFECPHCRRMHAKLTNAISRARTPVRMVRKMLPLDIHPNAVPAAIAYCCADAQGKGEEMAAALYAAAPEDLTPAGCEKLAARVGCDVERYRRDLPKPRARVVAEAEEVAAAGVRFLPTTFIGDERIVGAGVPDQELTAMLHRAATR
jgi:uncharacterized membrane protein/predicted DsbA family dithiol-disulfide isomerase